MKKGPDYPKEEYKSYSYDIIFDNEKSLTIDFKDEGLKKFLVSKCANEGFSFKDNNIQDVDSTSIRIPKSQDEKFGTGVFGGKDGEFVIAFDSKTSRDKFLV
jgi:hypothetical protein